MSVVPTFAPSMTARAGTSAITPSLTNDAAINPVAVLLWMLPGIVDAFRAGEVTTALLLIMPPLLGTLLTGPVPVRAARLATHWPAVIAALIAPFTWMKSVGANSSSTPACGSA